MTEEKEAQSLEKSAFFSDWQERYQKHLQEQGKTPVSTEKESSAIEQEPSAVAAETVASLRKSFQRALEKKESLFAETETATKTIKKRSIPTQVWLKASPILLVAAALLLLSLYAISPLSKQKQFDVTGNQAISSQEIIGAGKIPVDDYAVTTWLHLPHIEKVIADSHPRIASVKMDYAFPNRFTIRVKEYTEVGYLQQNGELYPILSNGKLSSESLAKGQQPSQYMTVELQDQELIERLVKQLSQVDSAIVQKIQRVDLQPGKVTADLLSLTMSDGHQVLVPLQGISKKLPYYTSIASQLTLDSVIDMEVGIFSYPR